MLRCSPRLFSQIRLHKPVQQTVAAKRRYLSKKELPTTADVVIAGGGAIGTSIAYHLTQFGWKDVVLLEQGSLGCGTSWHAAGLVGTVRNTYEATQYGQYAIDLFAKLEQEYGLGFKQCGSLLVAKSEDRATVYKRNFDRAYNEWGIDCRLLSPEECGEVNPLIRTDDVKLGFHIPQDGVVNPTDVVQAYSKGATKNGAAQIFEEVEVRKIVSEGRSVKSVQTNQGEIKCGHFINAAGMWANELGMLSTPPVEISLQPCQHFYVVTKGIGVDPMMPVTRDHDAHLYIREWSGGLMAGGFEPNALPAFYEGIPKKFEFQLLEENWDQFGFLMEGILNRFPCVNDAEIRSFVNGPESFTPDGFPHLSFSEEFDNYMMVCGLNSGGIVNSPGYGRMAAELLTHGESPFWNPYQNDIRRMPPGSSNKFYRRAIGPVTLTTQYKLVHPQSTYEEAPRNVINSPLHQSLNQHGAFWHQKHNWEIPLYFKEHGQGR